MQERIAKSQRRLGRVHWEARPQSPGIDGPTDPVFDFVYVIMQRRPKVIVELGSGVSTILAGLCAKRLGQCHVFSVDHDEDYASKTARQVHLHGIEGHVTIIHAPLREMLLGGQSYKWYDEERLVIDAPIDLLIVDGPPCPIHQHARYPALPVLGSKIADGAVVIMDDYIEEDQQRIANVWLEENPALRLETLDTEKGTAILATIAPKNRGDNVGV